MSAAHVDAMTDTYEPNRDDISGRFTPDQPSAPQIGELTNTSVLDQVNAAVLEMFPDAVSWEAQTTEYDNGYFYGSPIIVTAADGSAQEVGEDELNVDVSALSYEQQAGESSLTTDLSAYKGGLRTPAVDVPDEEEDDWRENLADRFRTSFPELHKIVLHTELWDNGFYFSTEGTGVDYTGNETLVDLSEFEDELTEASADVELGLNTEESIELVN